MLQSKLIELIRQFSRKEVTRFNEMALSPYFNKNQQVQKLVTLLSQQHPNFTDRNVSRYLIFERIWGDEAFDLAKIRHVFNYTQRLAEKFLAYNGFEKHHFSINYNLTEGLKDKLQLNTFEKQIENHLEKYKNDYELFRLNDLADLHYSQQADRNSNYLTQKVKYLDRFYLTEKLKNACEMLNRQRLININFDFALLDDLIIHLKDNFNIYKDAPLVQLYYLVFLINSQTESEPYYNELTALIEQVSPQIEQEEKRNIYNYAQNYCILKINQGKAEFLDKMFGLIQKMTLENVLLENNQLSERNYKNIVTIGLRLNEFDWVYNFIENYKQFLPKELATNAYNYNLSVYYYSKQDYNNALSLLNSVEYSDPVYNLGAKVMLLKIYFETEETEALLSLEKSFTQYLRRNKLISQPKYDRFKNLFKLSVKAFRLKQDWSFLGKKERNNQYTKLQAEISQSDQITNKAWLVEQINLLK